MMRPAGQDRRCTALLGAVYALLAILILTEKWGQRTDDTRLELTERPAAYLHGTFSLWHPGVSLGELQNQAYGYLFPQGSYYALLHWLGVPAWVSERLWSFLVLLIAAEGVRRLARSLHMGPWAAAVGGLAYALTPRMVAEVGVRSAEILPGAVLPWALLPLLHLIQGRRRPRDAAILSAAAFAFGGGINGTATAAPGLLLAIVVGWALVRRRVRWSFALGWAALLAASNAWWIVSLLRLGAYSPPFFDYVEDARTTTSSAGFANSLRGASNWVDFLQVGGSPWWPGGYELSFSPWLVVGTALVAILGLVGLLRYRGVLRTPLLLGAAVGLLCQVAAHTTGHSVLDGPFAQHLQDFLDRSLAPLRNVAKADPILRVPIAVGVAVLVDEVIGVVRSSAARRRSVQVRQILAGAVALALAGGLVAMSAPIAGAETRTPGWVRMPSYWTQAADYVAKRPGTTWVIPGSGFGVQQWGWTMEEPMEAVGHSPWVTRSQVPLTPAATIRMLSQLESYLETGSGSPYLRYMLARLGVTQILLRHDLDPEVSQVPNSSIVSVALARSPGITRVKEFGQLDFGPAIEVFRVAPVRGGAGSSGFDVRDTDRAVTVAGSVEDAVSAVGQGRVAPNQPMVLARTDGWSRPADVVGDGFRRRERAFGRIHDAESNVMSADEPAHTHRVLADYPGPPGVKPVVARYLGIAGVDASSSRGWVTTLGEVRPEEAPWSAMDGDPTTYWRPAAYLPVVGQWWQVRLRHRTPIGRVRITEAVDRIDLDRAGAWRVSAGGRSVTVRTDLGGHATADLGGVMADRVRVEVAKAPRGQAAVGLSEVRIAGVHAERTLVVPPVRESRRPSFLFSAVPESRACVTTLLGPDCDVHRAHASEESTGIDRTFTVGRAASGTVWRMQAVVVARSDPSTTVLLQPFGGLTMRASSWYADDPTVSPRMAYDDDHATEWIADPRDPRPTLHVDLGQTRTLRRLTIAAPSGIAARPGSVILRTRSGQRRRIDLGGFGAFPPVRTRHLSLTFLRAPGTSSSSPLGVAEVHLHDRGGGRLSVPLRGAGRTGSVCGYGPTLVVDGHRTPTRVTGRIGTVVAGGQLAVHPCGARPWRLAPGMHRVRLLSTAQFQPVALNLLPDGLRPAAQGRSRSLSVDSDTDTRVVLHVGPGREAVVSAPFNLNSGWTAVAGGRELTPITVDGWAQGWILPASASGRVVLTFSPQRSYLVSLLVGLGLLGVVVLGALWTLVRRPRPVAESAAPSPVAARHGHRGTGPMSARRLLTAAVASAVAAVAVGWLLAGPVIAAAALLGVLLASRPTWAQATVGVVLTGAAVATAIVLTAGPRQPGAAIDLVTGAAVALGLASALAPRRTEP